MRFINTEPLPFANYFAFSFQEGVRRHDSMPMGRKSWLSNLVARAHFEAEEVILWHVCAALFVGFAHPLRTGMISSENDTALL